jgi:L-aminopeptidase/D-esterase-like protein
MTRDERELPEGILVGHWTDAAARTGCTVVLAPDGALNGVARAVVEPIGSGEYVVTPDVAAR